MGYFAESGLGASGPYVEGSGSQSCRHLGSHAARGNRLSAEVVRSQRVKVSHGYRLELAAQKVWPSMDASMFASRSTRFIRAPQERANIFFMMKAHKAASSQLWPLA